MQVIGGRSQMMVVGGGGFRAESPSCIIRRFVEEGFVLDAVGGVEAIVNHEWIRFRRG
jgi:hypothetical protein